jgi:flagellar biosynthetic protein FlhB
MAELRRTGAVFHSIDLEQLLVLVTGFIAVSLLWNVLYRDMKYILVRSFLMIGEQPSMQTEDLITGFLKLVLLLGPDLLLITGCVAGVAILAVMLQTDWNKREKWISLRWDFINPVKGLKRIFSIMGLMNLFKAVLKLVLVLPIGYWALQGFAPKMVQLIHMSITDVLNLTGAAVGSVFWKIMYILGALTLGDIAWGKYQWLRQNKMTKEEVKDERKAVEGDETMRRKMIAKGMARLVQKLKTTVPKADVIITNPTHYAVAIKYDRDKFAAPVVVAKGTDFIAQRIREIATEHNIPILERKALARALYASTEVGSEIPRDLFRAVAEVLAYVFRQKRGQQPAKVQS